MLQYLQIIILLCTASGFTYQFDNGTIYRSGRMLGQGYQGSVYIARSRRGGTISLKVRRNLRNEAENHRIANAINDTRICRCLNECRVQQEGKYEMIALECSYSYTPYSRNYL